jgi:dissimilatory sulfite reductase (desulfoviridin) alpha/beta subunit
MYKDFGVHMKGGVITERDPDLCTVRIRLPAGKISVDQLRGIARIAKKYGVGIVHCTTRQALEIPHMQPSMLGRIEKALAKNGTPVGSERDEIVNIIACPGTDRCKFGNIDTINLAQKIDARLFGKEMPVKIRIAVSGCPNACTSPMLNEIGIMGRVRPVRTPGLCTGCGTCVQYCKENAIQIKNGVSVLDPKKCVQCGVCIRSCPFNTIQADHSHYLLLVGGRRGRHPHLGRDLIMLEKEDQVVSVVEKIVTWVYRRAWSGRLLSDQMDDLQFEQFKKDIAKDVSASQK